MIRFEDHIYVTIRPGLVSRVGTKNAECAEMILGSMFFLERLQQRAQVFGLKTFCAQTVTSTMIGVSSTNISIIPSCKRYVMELTDSSARRPHLSALHRILLIP